MRGFGKLSFTVLAAAMLVLAPRAGLAEGFGRGGHKGHKSGSSSSSSSSSYANSSGSSQGGFGRGGSSRGYQVYTNGSGRSSGGGYVQRGYADRGYVDGPRWGYGYGWYDPPVVVEPYYSVWGVYPYGYYGYGYYPYWGAPPIAQAPEAPRTTTAELYAGALFSTTPGLAGSVGIDGLKWGFNLKGVVLGSQDPSDPTVFDPMPFFSTHLTYSLITDPHTRVRAEVGMSGVVGTGAAYYGPDLGASAQLAVLGPLALEGGAHWTPLPADILDLDAAAALHFGALGIKAGWHLVRLDDTAAQAPCTVGVDCGVDVFSGPEVQVGLVW